MKSTANPIRTTIIWGIAAGLAYIPLCYAFSLFVFWPLNIKLSLSVLLAGYGILLSRWARQPLRSILFPLLLLFAAAFCFQSTSTFLLTVMGVLGWIRSGVCFKEKSMAKRLVAEIALGLGAGLLVSGAVPAVNPVWALGVWLFFLIQTLYFVLFGFKKVGENGVEADPFEKAKMAAEAILSRWVH